MNIELPQHVIEKMTRGITQLTLLTCPMLCQGLPNARARLLSPPKPQKAARKQTKSKRMNLRQNLHPPEMHVLHAICTIIGGLSFVATGFCLVNHLMVIVRPRWAYSTVAAATAAPTTSPPPME